MRLKTHYDGYTNYAISDFNVTLESGCLEAVITPNSKVMSSTNITYIVGDDAIEDELNPRYVTLNMPERYCPRYIFSLTNKDGSAIDDELFTLDQKRNKLKIFTESFGKIGKYKLTLVVQFDYEPFHFIEGLLDFTVHVLGTSPYNVTLDEDEVEQE